MGESTNQPAVDICQLREAFLISSSPNWNVVALRSIIPLSLNSKLVRMDYLSGVISGLYSKYYPQTEPESLCDKSRQIVDNLLTQSKLAMEHSGLFLVLKVQPTLCLES